MAKSAPALADEQIVLIAIDDIDDSDRRRPSDPLEVAAIAASMRRKAGQLQAIDVCRLLNQASKKPFKLVFGGHRIDAVRLNGGTHIKAVIRSADAFERREREIHENFFRADLAPLDRATFVSDLMALEKARRGIAADRDGRALNADKRSEKFLKFELDNDLRILRKSMGLQEAVAKKLGLSQQEISRQLPLTLLSASIVARIRKLPIAGNASALRTLAGMGAERQAEVLDLIEAGRAKGVNEAAAILDKKPVRTAEQKRSGAFFGAFSRMGTAERKAALRELARQMTDNEQSYMADLVSSTLAEAAE